MANTGVYNVDTYLPASAAVINTRRFVKIDATSGLLQQAVAGEHAVGVADQESKATETKAIRVILLNGPKVRVDANGTTDIAVGDPVSCDANGRAQKASGTQKVLGIALEALTATTGTITIATGYSPSFS